MGWMIVRVLVSMTVMIMVFAVTFVMIVDFGRRAVGLNVKPAARICFWIGRIEPGRRQKCGERCWRPINESNFSRRIDPAQVHPQARRRHFRVASDEIEFGYSDL